MTSKIVAFVVVIFAVAIVYYLEFHSAPAATFKPDNKVEETEEQIAAVTQDAEETRNQRKIRLRDVALDKASAEAVNRELSTSNEVDESLDSDASVEVVDETNVPKVIPKDSLILSTMTEQELRILDEKARKVTSLKAEKTRVSKLEAGELKTTPTSGGDDSSVKTKTGSKFDEGHKPEPISEKMNSMHENENGESIKAARSERIHSSDIINVELVHVAVVCCGPERIQETLNMVKSAVVTCDQPRRLRFHVFADDQNTPVFRDKFKAWKLEAHLYPIQFSGVKDPSVWRKLFKPCASQRLFIPFVLRQVETLIYVDTDILFLRPIERLQDVFREFDGKALAAMSPEHERPNGGWYNRFARHPYSGKLGINSGVMLMHLPRIRASNWLQEIKEHYQVYQYNITWGDQDLLNIYFHFHPDQLLTFGCELNYRPDHCMYGQSCDRVDHSGVAVLHGNRRAFHGEKYAIFKAIYDAFYEFTLGSDRRGISQRVKNLMKNHNNAYCDKLSKVFLHHLNDLSPTQVDPYSAPPTPVTDTTITPTPATPTAPPPASPAPSPPGRPAHYDVVVVACGDRQPETVVLMKSALLFTRIHVVFHIFTEKLLMPAFRSQMDSLPYSVRKRFTLILREVDIPEDSQGLKWRTLFKPCASQRLFLPTILSDVDSILYVDTDILFVDSLDSVFSHFSRFNSSQMVASASETDELSQSQSWYTRSAKHPFYQPLGINSGVMLMNLTRLRGTTFMQDIAKYYGEYKQHIPWGDQDLINIYFSFHPEQLYIYSCAFNYRNDHCLSGSSCDRVMTEGISILHGSRRIFQENTKWPTLAFRSLYVEVEKFGFRDSTANLVKKMAAGYDKAKDTACGRLKHAFFYRINVNLGKLKTKSKPIV